MNVNVNLRSQGSQKGHTRAKAPLISLDQPGRLKVGNIIALLGISHSTFYAGLKVGRYPKPDGKDGKSPWWSTRTIKPLLEPQT